MGQLIQSYLTAVSEHSDVGSPNRSVARNLQALMKRWLGLQAGLWGRLRAGL